MNINLFLGGTPVFGGCSPSSTVEFKPPMSRRVAAEYLGNQFTLGYPFHPSLIEYQRNNMQVAEAKGVSQDDVLVLYVVPEKHILRTVMVEVDIIDKLFEGASLQPVALLYNQEKGTYSGVNLLSKLSPVSPAAASLQVQDIAAPKPAKATDSEPYLVPLGNTLVLGFKIISMPSDKNMRFSNTSARMSIVSKIEGFDIPVQV